MKPFFRFDEGQDLIEYALLACLISIIALAAIRSVGGNVQGVWARVEAALVDFGNPGNGNPGNGNPGNGNPGNGNPGNGKPVGNPGTGNPGNGNPRNLIRGG